MPNPINGKSRDFAVMIDIPSIVADMTNLVSFAGNGGEQIRFYVDGNDPSSATFPVPTTTGSWVYKFSELKPGWFSVSLKQVVAVPTA